MVFFEVRPPIKTMLRGYSGESEWLTEIIQSKSGFETANQSWSFPLHRFLVPTIIDNQEIFEMIHFHYVISQGRANRFRVKDWDDYKIVDSQNKTRPILGNYDGTESIYQLKKTYSIFGYNKDRVIKKPVHNGLPKNDGRNTVSVYIGDTKIQEGVGVGEWTVDATTGVITIKSGGVPGEVSADAEFDVPCRMDQESLPFTPLIHGDNGTRRIEPIEIVEVKI